MGAVMQGLGGRRILVVEDEALVAMLVEDALIDAGAEVVGPAATVEEALALVRTARVDAAVLDLNLAGQSSAAVADAMRDAGIPFLVATGYGAGGLPDAHAAAPVLTKPYAPEDLVAALERLCG